MIQGRTLIKSVEEVGRGVEVCFREHRVAGSSHERYIRKLLTEHGLQVGEVQLAVSGPLARFNVTNGKGPLKRAEVIWSLAVDQEVDLSAVRR